MKSLISTDLSLYKELLQKAGSLSRLFSDSNVPFLHYRIAENIFCMASGATNLARIDMAYDATLGPMGIGVKTFRFPGKSKSEKIAEFNRLSDEFIGLSNDDLAHYLAELRNDRIEIANNTYGIEDAYYHCIARRPGEWLLFEIPYIKIDYNSICNVIEKPSGITFTDRDHQYSFNRSKSTLSKTFNMTAKNVSLPVSIADKPLDLINVLKTEEEVSLLSQIENRISIDAEEGNVCLPYVYLPLYAIHKGKKYVPEKSGLNQWNAGGRLRDPGEVYIPIPTDVHKKKPDFFPERDVSFTLVLPDQKELSAKVCQQGSKALMTNPNRAMSDWLLRRLFNLPERQLMTYEILRRYNIDCVRIEYLGNNRYGIEFGPLNEYENFMDMM
jgi:hypothetical protein